MSNYISLYNETDINANNLTVNGDVDLSDADVIVGTIKFANGSETNPSITFASDNSTGFYLEGKNTLSVTTGGVETLRINNSGTNLFSNLDTKYDIKCNNIKVGDGNDNFPSISFTNDPTSGIFRYQAGTLSFTANSSNYMDILPTGVQINFGGLRCYGGINLDGDLILNTGNLILQDGSNTAPSLYFAGDTTTGIYKNGVITLSITSNGIETARFNSTQIQFFAPISMGTNSINCGSLTTSGDITVGGNLVLSAGSSSAPSLYFTGDTTTGIYKNGVITLSITSNGIETARFNSSQIQLFAPLAMGTNSINCGAITCKAINAGTNSITCGSITSSGTFSNGTNSITCGAITSSGNFSNGTNSITCGAITSSGNFSNGTNSITCGVITSSGTFSNGTNSMTCGAIISSGNFSNGTNTLSCGSSFINGTLLVGKASPAIATGWNKLQIYGTDGSSAGPHIQVFTNIDVYPLFQQLNWQHDFIVMGFDCYNDGNWRSSNSGANFQIVKNSSTLSVNYASGITAGSISPVFSQQALAISNTGATTIQNLTCNAGYVNGTLVVGKASPAISTGWNRLQIYGSDGSSAGPHVQAFTSLDTYPVFQQLNWQHDFVVLGFDCYNDGSWRSSYLTSNFQIAKKSDVLSINYASGIAHGSVSPVFTQQALTVSNAGLVTIPNLTVTTLNSTTINCTNEFVSSTLVAGKASPAIATGFNKLQIYGTDGSSAGPHIQTFTSGDNYPLFQMLNWQHNVISMAFDCYTDGSWRSSNLGSNFQIYKLNNVFSINYASGYAQGAIIPITTNISIAVNASGQVGIGRDNFTTASQRLQIYGTDNSSSLTDNANISTYTSADNYPLFQLQSQQHNSVKCNFDLYFDGSNLRSSNVNSNFQLGKSSNQFQVVTGSGNTQGSIATLAVASYWDITGNFVCNQKITGAQLSLTAQPCLMMSASTYISVSTATHTLFNGFDTQDYSTGSIGFVSGSTATVPSAGTYLITFEMSFDSTIAILGVWYQMYLKKNGAGAYGQQLESVTTGTQFYLSSSTQMRLATSDTIQLYVYQNTGGNLHVGTVSNGVARLEITKLF